MKIFIAIIVIIIIGISGMFIFGQNKFDTNLFQPTGGVISGMWFSNPHVGIEANLFYAIEINLAPFEYDRELQETSIVLDFIKLPVKSYRELANQSFSFPTNPTEGYIDGSVYISTIHNPFDVTKINFGSIKNDTIEAEFYGLLLFEDDSAKPTDVKISTNLKFDNIIIHCDKLSSMSSEKMQEFVKEKLDLNFFRYDSKDNVFKYNSTSIP